MTEVGLPAGIGDETSRLQPFSASTLPSKSASSSVGGRMLAERRVRLGSSEFFGELALLSGRPQQADRSPSLIANFWYCDARTSRCS
jgi:hypothetical protein